MLSIFHAKSEKEQIKLVTDAGRVTDRGKTLSHVWPHQQISLPATLRVYLPAVEPVFWGKR